MGAWKHDAEYLRKAQDDEELRLYSMEQDYLHGIAPKVEVLTNVDPADEHEPKPRDIAHKTK